MFSKIVLAAAVASFAAVPLTGALAKDRLPNPKERAHITAALKDHGFRHWRKIELDDGVWEVDDAVGKDGRRHDVKLNRKFKITRVKLDD